MTATHRCETCEKKTTHVHVQGELPDGEKVDIALLQGEHDLLREAIRSFPAPKLNRRAPESKWTYAEHIHGIAAHDLYHTGQIQLLKRLSG